MFKVLERLESDLLKARPGDWLVRSGDGSSAWLVTGSCPTEDGNIVRVRVREGSASSSLNFDTLSYRLINSNTCVKSLNAGKTYRFKRAENGVLIFRNDQDGEVARLNLDDSQAANFDEVVSPDTSRVEWSTEKVLPPGTTVVLPNGKEDVILEVRSEAYTIVNSDGPHYVMRDHGVVSRDWAVSVVHPSPNAWKFNTVADHVSGSLKKNQIVWCNAGNKCGEARIERIFGTFAQVDQQANCGEYNYTIRWSDNDVLNNVMCKHVLFRLQTKEEVEKDSKKMSEKDTPKADATKTSALDVWKESAIRGAHKAGARQLVSKLKAGSILFLRSKLPKEAAEDLEKYTNNKYVDGMLAGGLGAVLTYAPVIKDHRLAKAVASELRSDGFSNVFEEVVEFATGTLFPLVLGGLNALDSFESNFIAVQEMPTAASINKIRIPDNNAPAVLEAQAEMEAALEAEMKAPPKTMTASAV